MVKETFDRLVDEVISEMPETLQCKCARKLEYNKANAQCQNCRLSAILLALLIDRKGENV